jgi:hypothetical protein
MHPSRQDCQSALGNIFQEDCKIYIYTYILYYILSEGRSAESSSRAADTGEPSGRKCDLESRLAKVK